MGAPHRPDSRHASSTTIGSPKRIVLPNGSITPSHRRLVGAGHGLGKVVIVTRFWQGSVLAHDK